MDLIQRFHELIHSQDANDWNKAVLGDQSVLARMLRDAPDVGFERTAKTLFEFRADRERFPRIVGTCSPQQEIEVAKSIVEGCANSLRAMAKIGHQDYGAAATFLSKAVNGFGNAWCPPEPTVSFQPRSNQPGIQAAFAGLNGHYPQAACWIVYDLVDRWFRNGRQQPLVPQSAATPLLGAITDLRAGRLLRLTVELFDCPDGVLCPDPLGLGLTGITVAGKKLAESMTSVWTVSGLKSQFRARWRIENPPERERSESTTIYPSVFSGRSAEAATLCALLAASGDPYGEKPGARIRAADPLDLKVAISATVASSASSGRPAPNDLSLGTVSNIAEKLALGAVHKIPEKLRSALPVVDTVVLTPAELGDNPAERREVDEIRNEESARQSAGQVYGGLHIAEAETVADALDLLLVKNRHLAKYQQVVRDKWLCQWEGETGKAAKDKAEWTEAMADAARQPHFPPPGDR